MSDGRQYSPPRSDPIDWAGLEARYSRRPQFVDRLTEVAIRTMRDVPAELRRLADAGRLADIATAAHSLRTGTDVIMANGPRDLAAQVEAACRAGDAVAVLLARELADAIAQVLIALDGRLNRPSV